MTPDELAAIRERDAAADTVDTSEPHVMVAVLIAAEDDRRALLAEVDRLYARLATYEAIWADEDMVKHAERARIRAAVEGLPEPHYYGENLEVVASQYGWDKAIAAVRRAIDGEAER